MNFMERLEEGLSEESINLTKHMRVSTYRKTTGTDDNSDNPSESLLFDDTTDLAESQENGTDDTIASAASAAANTDKLAGYSHIEDSYFSHAAP